jgi:hypothetical protein
MPDCDAALRQLSDLLNGDLDGGDAAALDRHLAACEPCYRKSVQLLRLDRAFTQMAARNQVWVAPKRQNKRFVFSLVGIAAAAAVLVAVYILTTPKPTAPMVVASVTGTVMLDDAAVGAGDEIRPGQSLVTGGKAQATLRFADSTVVEVSEKTTIRNLREADGKRLTLVRGDVAARVAPQATPMIFESKSGEARVLGTALRLVVDDELEQTRLEVTEGKVQLTRWSDRKSVDVAAGHFAVAAAGVELTARPLSTGKAPKDLFQFDYATLRGMLQLKSRAWATLPWHTSVAEAREAAFREKKPIFLFVASGQPLGKVGHNGIASRERVFSDPTNVKLLTEKFVLLAVDNNVHPHPDEVPWLDKNQVGYRSSTYAIAVLSPDGTRLAHGAVFDPDQARHIMTLGLKGFKPPTGPLEEIPRKGGTPLRQPPEGGAVMRVTWKGFFEAKSGVAQGKELAEALGSDRLWIRKDEVEALAKRTFPAGLKNRILKFAFLHFVGSQTRFDVGIDEAGRIVGQASGDEPAEDIALQGFLEVKDGKIVRFELLARGEGAATTDGFQASLSQAPPGQKVPLAVYLELGDPAAPIDRILPHGIAATNYFK